MTNVSWDGDELGLHQVAELGHVVDIESDMLKEVTPAGRHP
jgi:hypothetical protein